MTDGKRVLPFLFRRQTRVKRPERSPDWLDAPSGGLQLRVTVTTTTPKDSDPDVDAPPRPRSE